MGMRIHKTRQDQMIAGVDRLDVSTIAKPVAWTNADDLVAADGDVDLRRIVPIRVWRQRQPGFEHHGGSGRQCFFGHCNSALYRSPDAANRVDFGMTL